MATYNDHRMAMCFSLAALSDTPVTILIPNARPKHFRIISSSWRGLARSLNQQRQ
ncbi:hypothetical protein ACVXHB_13680 [Escherichia coli]